eukprot:COSAG01_NODE_560_length_15462_cov_18.361192_2_plen_282_part_00
MRLGCVRASETTDRGGCVRCAGAETSCAGGARAAGSAGGVGGAGVGVYGARLPQGGLHRADIGGGILPGHARRHGPLCLPGGQHHLLPRPVRLHGGLWRITNHGAQMPQGGLHTARVAARRTLIDRWPRGADTVRRAPSRRHRQRHFVRPRAATRPAFSLTRQPRISPIQCGCTAGFGRSLTTGSGCRKADSVTQVLAAAPRQDTRGNTDHSASSTGADAAGRAPSHAVLGGQPHGSARLHGGLWLVADHGARILQGGPHRANTGGDILPGHARRRGTETK